MLPLIRFIHNVVAACAIILSVAAHAQVVSHAANVATPSLQVSGGQAAVHEGSDGPPVDAAYERASLRRLEAETRYFEAYYDHLQRMNRVTEGKFLWQDRASEVTLWLVVFIVLAGVSLAVFQLWIAFHRGGQITETSLELSASNFRVTSSVVGVIVLLISVAFLYLFLKEVYHVDMVDIQAGNEVGGAAERPLSPADFGLPAAGPPLNTQVGNSVRPGANGH